MGIIQNVGNGQYADRRLTPKEFEKQVISEYQPDDKEREVRSMILKHYALAYTTQYTPRREFNDLSVVGRMQVDQMSFNTYQPNNGEPLQADLVNAWKSNAIRPVVRNKAVSIASHATARLIFPKVFAFNNQSTTQEEAAKVMRDLMEWAGEQSDYARTSMESVVTAMWSPASIGYTQYGEVYRNVKREKGADGNWIVERMCDEDLSGFNTTTVPVDELFIENIYESDIQKQSWLIWRKVISYSQAQAKYGNQKNWNFVKPGMQVLFNDANSLFYDVYDPNMRTDMVEEVIYWNKAMDLCVPVVNAVIMGDCDQPNPRNDKLYPFYKFGYELVDEGKFFYYKSLAFKMQQDANIINTLYPMIIDGTYLSLMPPMINVGSEAIGSDVIVPGAVTTLSDPNAKLTPIQVSQNMKVGMDTLFKVDESLDESSQDPIQQGQAGKSTQTAYEISRLEQNANTVLGLFIKMISQYVKQYGRLQMGDILQYLTIADVETIEDNPELVYKTFLVESKGKNSTKKIIFDGSLPDEKISPKSALNRSYDVLGEQKDSGMDIARVNPKLFRDLKYQLIISPDVLNPRSEDLERAMNLEEYDRLIANPLADQEQALKMLLNSYPSTKRDPDKYISKQQPQSNPMAMASQMAQGPGMTPSPLAGAPRVSSPKVQ